FYLQNEKLITVSRSVAIHQLLYIVAIHRLFYANSIHHATTPGSQHAEKTSFVSTNANSESEGGGPGAAQKEHPQNH
ncbi:hypothetical protein, partial [uncultured Robinsoniella sp.]|uniref:hypothetical protein n=1 Tax=uncultured Robinsoniella sp. TaxID=904190 RepID=UPI00374EF493